MFSQSDKGHAFKALHDMPGCFVIPNPWDAGSAKILTSLGFKALATTSAGLAFALGRRDCSNLVSREEALRNAGDIASASELPVTADLENGFGEEPSVVGDTIRLAAEVGLVGCSIEDATGEPEKPIYEFRRSVERIVAAVEAARTLAFPFVLTARAENFLHGNHDLHDTIARLQAYREAGADVLYAPGLRSLEDIGTVVREVEGPVNVVMGLSGVALSVAELAEVGVKRISLGSALNRAALGAFIRAATEVQELGTFEFSRTAPSIQEIYQSFESKS